MLKPIRKEFEFGGRKVVLETGRIARQASGAVLVTMDRAMVLATVVGSKHARAGQEFFPLTVNYEEKTYAAGRIPGGFFRREGRPTEKETLTSRLIDRPIRPLFPKGFMNEIQVHITVMSAQKDLDSDICGILGASACLAISGIPFDGPIGATRVGYIDDQYVTNPTFEQLENSDLNMVVAGTDEAVLMVESEACELSEDQMLGAVIFGHMEMQGAIRAIRELAAEAGKPRWDWQPPAAVPGLAEAVKDAADATLAEAYTVTDKLARQDRVRAAMATAVDALAGGDEPRFAAADVQRQLADVEHDVVRRRILAGEPRIDGRDQQTVRPIEIEVGVLPSTHGSALFTRGETQAVVTATLGTARDAATVETLEGVHKDGFMLHYNFPPYSVGETGRTGGPKRREIGHGRLAKRGLAALMPDATAFPYTIRVVSEITESNGSSSMASVCGGSLALMDAGVPIRSPVAGVAMGLVKEGDQFAILTDIMGDEDHLGDMDFKVAGTETGVTALQMDIKIQGITEEIMERALQQAHHGRLHILGEMNKVLAESRSSLSENAPSITTLKINPERIRDVIGKGGATIRSIVEASGAEIDIQDNGEIRIYAASAESKQIAIERINELAADAEVGRIYRGAVQRIVDFGAFVQVLPGKDGLLHISQIAEERVEKVTDYLSEGQEIEVVVLDVDERGRIKLSMKDVEKHR